jgi:hypothetical protein
VALLVAVFLATRDIPFCPDEMPEWHNSGPPAGIHCPGPLVGTWTLIGVRVDRRLVNLSDLREDSEFTRGQFTFGSDGLLHYAICGPGSSPYQFSSRHIRRGDTVSILVGCSKALSDLNRVVAQGLTGRYRVADQVLTFTGSGIVLTFERTATAFEELNVPNRTPRDLGP